MLVLPTRTSPSQSNRPRTHDFLPRLLGGLCGASWRDAATDAAAFAALSTILPFCSVRCSRGGKTTCWFARLNSPQAEHPTTAVRALLAHTSANTQTHTYVCASLPYHPIAALTCCSFPRPLRCARLPFAARGSQPSISPACAGKLSAVASYWPCRSTHELAQLKKHARLHC